MIRYYATFYGTDRTEYTLKVYKDGYTGTPQEITLSGDPITIEYTLEDIFKPTKLSGATIKVLTPNILEDLYTGKVTDIRIEIYKEDDLIWTGFNSPNIYNSEWLTDYDQTEINAIDTLSALQYFKYETVVDGTYQTVSFYDILSNCFSKVNQSGNIDTLLYMNTLGEYADPLREFRVLELTFFDEEDEPITLLEVVEHICQFLGVTITQYLNMYQILEVSKISSGGEFDFKKYDLANNGALTTFEGTSTIYKGEVAEANASISLGDVYNRIRILGNLREYEEELVIDPLDEDDFEPLSDGYSEFIGYHTTTDNNVVKHGKFVWNFYSNPKIGLNTTSFENWGSSYLDYNTYPSYKKYLVYKTEDLPTTFSVINRYAFYPKGVFTNFEAQYQDSAYDVPAKLSFNKSICFTGKFDDGLPYTQTGITGYRVQWRNTLTVQGDDICTMGSENRVYPAGSALVIALSSVYSATLYDEGGVNVGNDLDTAYDCNTYVNDMVVWCEPEIKWNNEGFADILAIQLKVKIGDKYWNGSEWTTTESYCVAPTQGFLKDSKLCLYRNLWNFNYYHKKRSGSDEGYTIPIDSTMEGKLEITITNGACFPSCSHMADNYNEWDSKYRCGLIHIKDFSCKLASPILDEFALDGDTNENADLSYSNDIDLKNVNEWDDITIYLNTYNPDLNDAMSYSYVYDSNLNFITDLLKDGYVCRPEEHLVRMYVQHYKSPKIIYSNILKNCTFEPIDGVYIESLDRTLAICNITYDLQFNTAEIKAYEI